ncbi:hypothetical protein L0F81_00160 [Streptomyces tricolor]|uniref:Uncharacterized protein n=1 Tax=Streptomyces tricolor TaxID=68277 RepID=A0ABS9J824_9ACTN|nr:hypothetical protein [Streptomyces tricolor]MCG0061712.1 hypothetical protein [Streptomyces tricolor]
MGLFTRKKHITTVEQTSSEWWTFYCSCRRVYGHGASQEEAQRKATAHENAFNR